MPHFIQRGSIFTQSNDADMVVFDQLPTGTYSLGFHPQMGFYYEQIDNFLPISKVYGDHPKMAKRILDTAQQRPNGTGVLLSGEKGSGKTMIAKMVSQNALELDWPTIVIGAPFCGDMFNKFIQEMEQPAVIIFDEFEKVYDEDKQKDLLTLLDGIYATKKLFILTVNDKWKVNTNMRNRPGRVYYSLEFEGLDRGFIQEYCDDNLQYPEFAGYVIQLASIFWKFNFDMLKAVVEEVNRYGETPLEVIKFLNVKPETEKSGTYDVSVELAGFEVYAVNPNQIGESPMHRQNTNVTAYVKIPAGIITDELAERMDKQDVNLEEFRTLMLKLDPESMAPEVSEKHMKSRLQRSKSSLYDIVAVEYSLTADEFDQFDGMEETFIFKTEDGSKFSFQRHREVPFHLRFKQEGLGTMGDYTM